MMATRKPKVAPAKQAQKEQKTSSSEEIELKDQGWCVLFDVSYKFWCESVDLRAYMRQIKHTASKVDVIVDLL